MLQRYRALLLGVGFFCGTNVGLYHSVLAFFSGLGFRVSVKSW